MQGPRYSTRALVALALAGVLVVAVPATAATLKGSKRSDRIVGTKRAGVGAMATSSKGASGRVPSAI